MERPDWVPEGIDTDSFSAARVYDYMLGGNHNFAIDREMARRGMEAWPDLPIQAQANRAFLHRAVRWLAETGVRQFLDIGSGIPTRGNVHEVAQKAAPEARVVYVDIDPVAVAHSRHLLADNEQATAIQEDLRRPAAILEHPDIRELLDFDQPVAVLQLAILHAISDDDDPYGMVAKLMEQLVPGSHLVISHPTGDSRPDVWARMVEMSKATPYPLFPRSRADVERFVTGLELVEPGLVWAPEWRPDHPEDVDDDPGASSNLVGIGRKP